MMSSKKLNISQIAELAGVSKATVSRVLNDYPHISAAMRQRVMKVVQETGYERNYFARMLTADRSNMIGLVISSAATTVFTDPYFPRLTRGISLATKANKLTLALFLCDTEQDADEIIGNVLDNKLLDGIIVTADHKNDAVEAMLQQATMPFVFVGRPIHDDQITYIDSDNIGGGTLATNYLIEQGYRRIAIIATDDNTSGEDRLQGYQRSLAAHHITYDAALVAYGDYTLTSGKRAMQQLLPAHPDAVFVTSDTMALGALHTLHDHHIIVPDDIALIGYDDLPPAVQAVPPLTTVHQAIEEVGAQAVETLLTRIIHPDNAACRHIVPVELVIRASTK